MKTSRRQFVNGATAFLLLSAWPAESLPLIKKKVDPDGKLLLELLDLENPIIFAASLLLSSPRIDPDMLPVGRALRLCHEAHRDTLQALARKHGENPPQPHAVYNFDESIENEKDILK